MKMMITFVRKSDNRKLIGTMDMNPRHTEEANLIRIIKLIEQEQGDVQLRKYKVITEATSY